MLVALAGVSLPVYFTGLVLLFLFTYGPEPLRWFPGAGGPYVGFTDDPLTWARNLVLPWVSLAFLFAALYARLTRANMLETMGEDYIRTARAKGLKAPHRRRASTRCGPRSPRSSRSSGSTSAACSAARSSPRPSSACTGIGKLSIDSIGQQDLPVIMGVTMIARDLHRLANIIVDVLYAVIDPRVRLHADECEPLR